MVRLPGHDLLAGEAKREGEVGWRSAKRVGRTEPTWMVEGRAVLRQEAGLVTLRVEDSFFSP